MVDRTSRAANISRDQLDGTHWLSASHSCGGLLLFRSRYLAADHPAWRIQRWHCDVARREARATWSSSPYRAWRLCGRRARQKRGILR